MKDLTRRNVLGLIPLPFISAAASSPRSVPTGDPYPVQCLVSRIRANGVLVTGITRIWEGGATSRCKLCPKCSADAVNSVCQIQVTADVADADAPGFSLVKFLRPVELKVYPEGGAL